MTAIQSHAEQRNCSVTTHRVTRAGGIEMHVCRAVLETPDGDVVAHEISRWSAETARREMLAWLRARASELSGLTESRTNPPHTQTNSRFK